MMSTASLRSALRWRYSPNAMRALTSDDIRALTPDDIRALKGVGPGRFPGLAYELSEVHSWSDDQIRNWLDPDAVCRAERQQQIQTALVSGVLSQDALTVILLGDERRVHVVWQRATTTRAFQAIGADLGIGREGARQIYNKGLRLLRWATRAEPTLRQAIAALSADLHLAVYGERPRQESP